MPHIVYAAAGRMSGQKACHGGPPRTVRPTGNIDEPKLYEDSFT